MKTGVRVFLLVVALAVQFKVLEPDVQAIDEQQMINPDSHIQTWINHIVTLETQEEVLREIASLKEGGESIEHLMQQLIYFQVDMMRMYRAGNITSSTMEKATWNAYGTISLLLEWDENTERITSASSHTLINAVLPYLGTKDPDLRSNLRDVLLWVDDGGGIDEVDYTEYESYIENKKDNPPQALIKYMYEQSPETALLSLMNVYMEDLGERQNIIQAEEAIGKDIERRCHGPIEGKPKIAPEAMSALNELSKYNQWWIHLYVAEILYRQPKFRTPEILERLKKDKHPLVSEALSGF